MSKTPEQMAEEYAEIVWDESELAPEDRGIERHVAIGRHSTKIGFLAGYKAAQQWISVKERLPEMYEWVLIDGPEVCKRIEPPSSNWKEQYAWETNHDSFYSPNDVTHWMPLPEPPKEEK